MNFIWQKLGGLIVVLIISAYAFLAARGPNGVPALMEKRRLVQELQEQNATLAADNLRKKERIERLKTSRVEQELEIREKLKRGKPGETEFILPNGSKDEPAPTQK